jgi:hypothetical protein
MNVKHIGIIAALLPLAACAPESGRVSQRYFVDMDIETYETPQPESDERYALFYADDAYQADAYRADTYQVEHYEPTQGAYLGFGPGADVPIPEVDALADKEHAVISFRMSMGEEFPEDWILRCISAQKTPFITVAAPADAAFDASVLDSLAASLAKFDIPMFVQIYPAPSDFIPSDYIAFFNLAARTIKTVAPNCAIVWTADAANALDAERFYPGDEYTDWIGIAINQTVDASGGFDPGSARRLDYFYQTFQTRKPLMLQLAVDYYSPESNAYYSREAAREIETIYTMTANEYPRIKLVNCTDDSGGLISNPSVMDAYAEAVSDSAFLSILDKSQTQSPQLVKSPFAAYIRRGAIFLSEKTLGTEIHVKNLSTNEIINGERFFNAAILEKNKIYRIERDDARRRVVLYSI